VVEEFEILFPAGGRAVAVRLQSEVQLERVPQVLGLERGTNALVLIGGADEMSRRESERLQPFFEDVIAELAMRLLLVVLDGGTDVGVMSLLGRARASTGAGFPLVGVAVEALVAVPSQPTNGVQLEPNHTHFVFVPGSEWGDEAPWLARLASGIGGESATVLVNGGEIAWRDAEESVRQGRPLVVLARTGRTADDLAAALRGERRDERATRLAATGLVHAIDVDDRDGLMWLLDDILAGRV